MSLNREPQHCNGPINHYISKSVDDIVATPDVTRLLNLINSVVDCQDTYSSPNLPQIIRKRSRSNSTILSPTSRKKAKTPKPKFLRIPPPAPIPRRAINSTDLNDSRPSSNSTHSIFSGENPSPRSYSSIMDYKDIDYKDSNHFSTPSAEEKYTSTPIMNHKLSTIPSIRIIERNNAAIDKEYNIHHSLHEDEPDMNHLIDPRSKHECKRLMFLYNSKSGGQKAVPLLSYMKAYTPLIYDLFTLNNSCTELQKLASDLTLYQHKLVICIIGGDGSQCWAASLIDKAIESSSIPITFPTIVPFPVGTGNDLSRALGWGNMERTPDKIIKHIADVEYCFNVTKRLSVLDRWNINYSFECDDEDIDVMSRFSPPLPTEFMCYLSFGYDAMITYNFAKERKMYPERFKSQLANQAVYLRMGLKEFVKPSNPVNDSILLEIDGHSVSLPKDTRSLKVVNINSAASGIFFWGYLKSNKDELQTWKRPQLNDGLIEVMATRGSTDLTLAKMRLGHAHRLAQTNEIKLKVIKTPVYLQIDGEGWCIEDKCTFHITLYDQLPTLIGYKDPRGVYHKYEADYYTDHMKETRHRYRDVIRIKYNIPRNPKYFDREIAPFNRKQSLDDFDIDLVALKEDNDGEDEKSTESVEGKCRIKKKKKQHNRSMSELQNIGKNKKVKKQKWKPLFANKNSWKRNRTDTENNNKKSRGVMKWF